jgi:hypothetical protein
VAKVKAYTSYKSLLPATSRKTVVKPVANQPTLEEMPGWWPGTYPEYLVFWAYKKLGYSCNADPENPGPDVVYQMPELGGATIIDFAVFRDHPPLATPVNGLYWHPLFGEAFNHDMDIMRRLQDKGYKVIVFDEDDVYLDALNLVRLAVKEGVDLSRYARLL